MINLRTAAEQALALLDCLQHHAMTTYPDDGYREHNRVKNALRAALAAEQPQPDYPCRSDGRCQYAIDSGAEGMGHCPRGKCVMQAEQPQSEPVSGGYIDPDNVARRARGIERVHEIMGEFVEQDGDGLICPKQPFSWETVAGIAMSYLGWHLAGPNPAPPPSAPEPSRTLTQDERDVFDAAERRSTKVVAPEPSEAEVEAAFIALHGAPSDYMFTAAMRVDAKARVRDALRAAAAARKA